MLLKKEKIMSMEDILKVLVDSRQQGNSTQGTDPMASLIGGLLGGGQPQSGSSQQSGGDLAGNLANLVGAALESGQQPTHSGGQQSGGLGNLMGLLETAMGSSQGGSQFAANDSIMILLQPFVTPLAKKANIPPEIALIVVSFVAHKLLAHHPTSGRDSNSFDLDDMLQQIGSGKIDSNMLHSSGMIGELSRKTGLDEATAEKSLQIGFSMVGKSAASFLEKNPGTASPKPKTLTGKSMNTAGAKSGTKSVKK
jgi:hypothetical protein